MQTKPALYPDGLPGYRVDLVTGLDPVTGEMTGYVSDYYAGQDGRSDDRRYPYARKRYEDSALSRLLEAGLPGEALAIRPGNTHVTRYRYGLNAAGGFFAELPEGQYPVVVTIDADGRAPPRRG